MLLDDVHAATVRFANRSAVQGIVLEAQLLADAAAADLRSATASLVALNELAASSRPNEIERRLLSDLLDRCEVVWADAEMAVLRAKAAARRPRDNGTVVPGPLT